MEITGKDFLRGKKRLMVIVPHQDDELLLAAGLIRTALVMRLTVDVVMATNGDCGCRDHFKGRLRLRESLEGLGLLGLPEEQFYILGYADTGMPAADSFLTRLYGESNPKRKFSSLCGSRTYGLEEKPEYHKMRFGVHGRYCRETFCQDLRELLRERRPECIVTTSPWDLHGDHSALYAFVCEVLRELWGTRSELYKGTPRSGGTASEGMVSDGGCPELYTGLVHSRIGDAYWPKRDTAYYDCPETPEQARNERNEQAEMSTERSGCQQSGEDARNDLSRPARGSEAKEWNRRIILKVPEEMRLERGAENLKLRALLKHETALEPGAREFLLSFIKDEEIFWKRDPWE